MYSKLEKIGELQIPIPEIPKGYIPGSELPTKKQKFAKTAIPRIFNEIDRDEFGAPIWTKKQEEFIWQEFLRCDNGYWFMCNGEPTYITGDHYHELNYWKIPLQGRGVGTKDYRDRDRRVHLFYDYCFHKADNCYGVIYMKHRRDGSTHRSNAIIYNRAIKRHQVLCGIQSKTEADAKSVFARLVNSWRKEPEFMQPIHDGSSDPKAVLRFFEPSAKTTKKNRALKESVALESEIGFRNSKSNAYDGEGLFLYLMNEAGKTTEADVSETWGIVKECLTVGDKITGKAIIESTVEEMEKKGGKNFIKIWSESNPNELNKNDRTTSGLYRLFISCADGLEGFIDEYGASQTKEATEFIMNNREDFISKKKFERLADYKRKYPLTEEDALSATNDNCLFNLEILEKRKNELDRKKLNGETWLRRGKFSWQDGVRDTKVIFEDDDNGNFLVGWLPENYEETNTYELVKGVRKPCHNNKYVIGVDPFEADKPGDLARSSQGAAYVFKKYDAMQEGLYHNSNFVVQYYGRPKKRNFFYEDMIKVAVFFSCSVAIENNKIGCLKYFEERGYDNYVMYRPAVTTNKTLEEVEKGEKGIPTGTKTHQQIAEFLESQVEDYGHNLLFDELIDDLVDFDISCTQKFDLTMAAGMTLIGNKKIFKNPKPPKNVYEYMRKHKRLAIN